MLSPEERAIVEATLACANVKRPHSWDTLHRIIKRHLPNIQEEGWAEFGLGRDEDSKAIIERTGEKNEQLLSVALQHYHGKLRDWLTQIACFGRSAYARIGQDLERNLGQGVALRPTLREGRLVYTLTLERTAGLFAHGTALILDKERGLASRLGQCGYCGRFNLTVEGRPRTHCNETHRLAYDRMMAAERMRAYRKRKKRRPSQKDRMTVSGEHEAGRGPGVATGRFSARAEDNTRAHKGAKRG